MIVAFPVVVMWLCFILMMSFKDCIDESDVALMVIAAVFMMISVTVAVMRR